MKKLTKLTISLATGLLTAIIFCIISFAAECEQIRSDVFRLHILANSDSNFDQQLKIKVRDRILEETKDSIGEAGSKEDIIRWAEDNIELIKCLAQDELRNNSSDYDINVEIVNMYFPTKDYERYTLPAGNYDALRITIGEAEGQNWWCVMFPQLCIPAAGADMESYDVFSNEQSEIIENGDKYEVSFLLVEWIEKIKNSF